MCPHGFHHNGFMATPALGTQEVRISHFNCQLLILLKSNACRMMTVLRLSLVPCQLSCPGSSSSHEWTCFVFSCLTV